MYFCELFLLCIIYNIICILKYNKKYINYLPHKKQCHNINDNICKKKEEKIFCNYFSEITKQKMYNKIKKTLKIKNSESKMQIYKDTNTKKQQQQMHIQENKNVNNLKK